MIGIFKFKLGFALLYMIRYPQIQSKVQEEIDRVLNGRPPSLSDRSRLIQISF